MAKKEVTESQTGRSDMGGFGDAVVKLTDHETGEVVAYIGMQEGEQKVHFAKAVTPDQVIAVSELLERKKFGKHISNERFDKAQAFADRKFS